MGCVEMCSIFSASFKPDFQKKIVTAASLHDLFRDISPEKQLRLVHELNIPHRYHKRCLSENALSHGPLAAFYYLRHLGHDKEVFDAVYHHTTSRAPQSMLLTLLRISDFCEASRTHQEAVLLRDKMLSHTHEKRFFLSCSFEVLQCQLMYLVNNSSMIHPDSIRCFNWLKKTLSGKLK